VYSSCANVDTRSCSLWFSRTQTAVVAQRLECTKQAFHGVKSPTAASTAAPVCCLAASLRIAYRHCHCSLERLQRPGGGAGKLLNNLARRGIGSSRQQRKEASRKVGNPHGRGADVLACACKGVGG